MTAYARVQDILPCTDTVDARHDWVDARHTSDQLYSGECSYCAALLIQHWWGWEFYTGEEHFDHEAWGTFENLVKITRPHKRGFLAEDERAEAIPMRFDPIPIGGPGQNTRAIYRPQELGEPAPDPMRPRAFVENLDEGPLVRFIPEREALQRVQGGENWAVYMGDPVDAAIERAEQAPRRGQYAQALYRGLRRFHEQERGLGLPAGFELVDTEDGGRELVRARNYHEPINPIGLYDGLVVRDQHGRRV